MGVRYRTVPLLLLLIPCLNFGLGLCLNDEGWVLLKFKQGVFKDPFGALKGWNNVNEDEEEVNDPCRWFRVQCHDGKVVILNLKDLCLEGILAPELGNLAHLKSILLDNNKFLGNRSPELHHLSMLSQHQLDENQLPDDARAASCNEKSFSWIFRQARSVAYRRLLKVVESPSPSSLAAPSGSPSSSPLQSPLPSQSSPSASPTSNIPSPTPSPVSTPDPAPVPAPAPAPAPFVVKPLQPAIPVQSPSSISVISKETGSQSSHGTKLLILFGVGAIVLVLLISIGVFIFRCKKVVVGKPWTTGLSGQLQKAFITGVPKLKRSELETACEDFSNIIGSSIDGSMYKGTLSSGVEIAVTSCTVRSAKDWSENLEAKFRKKIDTMSLVNHKNFVNLLGFCEEEKPFTRMMVFEYAPNGTLFEHLHIKEAEHLDWKMRLRIAMGVVYCLEHMHQLSPPLVNKNLHSTSVYLTEDYAAKISEFNFWNEAAVTKIGSTGIKLLDTHSSDTESNVYGFGLLLLEMLTGRLPYSMNNGLLVDWAMDYLRGRKPIQEVVDPTLKTFREEELEDLCDVITSCINPDTKLRPSMREVADRLREITKISPEGATPRVSPLWWAELEILSTEAS